MNMKKRRPLAPFKNYLVQIVMILRLLKKLCATGVPFFSELEIE